MTRILIADNVSEECREILERADLNADLKPDIPPEQLTQAIAGYDGLIVRSRIQVTREILEAGANLKVVGRAGVGTDNIDVETATRRGVVVMNTPQANTVAAAEHTFSLLMSLSRNITRADARMREGGWDRKKFVGVELRGKTLGVVGLGKVGLRIASYGLAFGMKIVAFDPYVSAEQARKRDIHLVELDEVLARSDFVTIHVPLTEKTRGLIGAERLARLKPAARLINASRGGIVKEAALVEALQKGTLAGAAIDVFESEPPAADHPLRSLPNTIVTPHLGASTEEAQVKVAVDIAMQFVDYFQHGRIRNAVNLALPAEPALLPYQDLAETLGHLASQLLDGRVDSIEVTAGGEIAAADTRALTANAIRGALRPICGNSVNLVNAALLADERDIQVVETRRKSVDRYKSLLTVRVGSQEGECSVSGSILEGKDPRITRVAPYDVDLKVAPHMLAMIYPDVPGIVGRFGTVMGRRGLNIANMTVGRSGPGQRAIIFVTVDDRVSDEVLAELQEAIPGLELIRAIEL